MPSKKRDWRREPDEDTCRLDWLGADEERLEDVRGHINNEGGTLREAIDALRKLQGT